MKDTKQAGSTTDQEEQGPRKYAFLACGHLLGQRPNDEFKFC